MKIFCYKKGKRKHKAIFKINRFKNESNTTKTANSALLIRK